MVMASSESLRRRSRRRGLLSTNVNGQDDSCQGEDCNENNDIPDICEISGGTEFDCDLDGVPDELRGAGPLAVAMPTIMESLTISVISSMAPVLTCNNNGFLDHL